MGATKKPAAVVAAVDSSCNEKKKAYREADCGRLPATVTFGFWTPWTASVLLHRAVDGGGRRDDSASRTGPHVFKLQCLRALVQAHGDAMDADEERLLLSQWRLSCRLLREARHGCPAELDGISRWRQAAGSWACRSATTRSGKSTTSRGAEEGRRSCRRDGSCGSRRGGEEQRPHRAYGHRGRPLRCARTMRRRHIRGVSCSRISRLPFCKRHEHRACFHDVSLFVRARVDERRADFTLVIELWPRRHLDDRRRRILDALTTGRSAARSSDGMP